MDSYNYETVSLTQATGWAAHYQHAESGNEHTEPIVVWTIRTGLDPLGWISDGFGTDLTPAWKGFFTGQGWSFTGYVQTTPSYEVIPAQPGWVALFENGMPATPVVAWATCADVIEGTPRMRGLIPSMNMDIDCGDSYADNIRGFLGYRFDPTMKRVDVMKDATAEATLARMDQVA